MVRRKKHRPGLRFIDIVKRKLEIVRQNPEKNARKKGNFRQSVIKTFPYVIVYTFYKKERRNNNS